MSEEFPIIGSNNNYWIKLSVIIGNYCPKKLPLAAKKEKRHWIKSCCSVTDQNNWGKVFRLCPFFVSLHIEQKTH